MILQKIRIHTDLILAYNNIAGKRENILQGSGVLVTYDDNTYLLTVAHVHRERNIIISGSCKIGKPKIERRDDYKIQQLKIVESCVNEDYSILSNYPTSLLTQKIPYDLSLS